MRVCKTFSSYVTSEASDVCLLWRRVVERDFCAHVRMRLDLCAQFSNGSALCECTKGARVLVREVSNVSALSAFMKEVHALMQRQQLLEEQTKQAEYIFGSARAASTARSNQKIRFRDQIPTLRYLFWKPLVSACEPYGLYLSRLLRPTSAHVSTELSLSTVDAAAAPLERTAPIDTKRQRSDSSSSSSSSSSM
jgi:hypothetical protein